MKLVYLAGLVLLLSACAVADNERNNNHTPISTHNNHRYIDDRIYGVDDSIKGVTCYADRYASAPLSCIKTFNPDSVR